MIFTGPTVDPQTSSWDGRANPSVSKGCTKLKAGVTTPTCHQLDGNRAEVDHALADLSLCRPVSYSSLNPKKAAWRMCLVANYGSTERFRRVESTSDHAVLCLAQNLMI
jgi:hypothetical protein